MLNRVMGEQTKHIGLRVPSELYTALQDRVGTDGRTLTDVVITLLNRGLGSVEQGTPSDLPGILQRLNNVEQRLTALESDRTAPSLDCRLVEDEPNDTPAPPPPAPRAGGEGGSYAADPPGGHPKADGGRWLSTSDAISLSASRGGPDNRATLKRWGQTGRLESIGLAHRPHGSKRNDLATYEDLRHPQP